jgi:FtsZ-binding cell division protein ZapB
LVVERRGGHEKRLEIEELKRSTAMLKQEAERHKLRVESKYFIADRLGLQKHMENYQSVDKGDASQRSDPDRALKTENEQLKAYIFQYEQQIKDLESELKNLQ